MLAEIVDEFDLDEEIAIGDQIAEEEGLATEYVENETDEFAIKSMQEFFEKKEYYCGGVIPHGILFSDENVRLVNEGISMEDGVQAMHDILDQNLCPDSCEFNLASGLSWQVQYIKQLLQDCASKRIPKIFAPGIILIYLDLCEGMRYKEDEWNFWN